MVFSPSGTFELCSEGNTLVDSFGAASSVWLLLASPVPTLRGAIPSPSELCAQPLLRLDFLGRRPFGGGLDLRGWFHDSEKLPPFMDNLP